MANATKHERERFHDHDVTRFLGISLGGAKSERTCVTLIDYYNKQKKAFVVDIFEGIGAEDELTGDQVLIDLLTELAKVDLIGVDAPLTLPPCLVGCESNCEGYERCKRPAVKWMLQQYRKAKAKNPKLKHFTPYSQRPVDLYFRYKHSEPNLLQDETMGANLAPQAVRMSYLKRHIGKTPLVEVWPKLSLVYLQKALRLSKRDLLDYRHMERGAHIRSQVLDRLVEQSSIFIYERDFKKLVTNMDAFDSFICGWVALQSELKQVVKFKSDVPLDSGWIQIPEL